MREQIADLVYPLISHGLRLKEQLERGETPDFDTEQAALLARLNDPEARRWAEFGGDLSVDGRSSSRRGGESFLGIRYALVSWLDEIFILDSPWARQWNERNLETQFYGTRLRAELFWEQARRAELKSPDALEVFFLCVMLGFRGELADHPDRLQTWVSATKALIAKQGQERPKFAELEPPISVPPHHGRERLERLISVAGIVALCLLLVLATILGRSFFG